MTTPLRELLEKYRNAARSEREKGAYFERLTKVWLETAPAQHEQFSKVLTWTEFAREHRIDGRDTGIDLVAQLADSPDDWCAVQCKFYAADYRIQKADIDSFFTASGRRPFTRRMIVDSTSAPWSEHAEAALEGQTVETIRVSLDTLEQSGVDWTRWEAEGEGEAHVVRRKEPRPDQREAIDDVVEGLKEADRGKLIMACGTGKTFVAMKIAEKMAGKGKRVLFLVPSLFLMSQTIKAWSIDSGVRLRSFAVCSDQGVGIRRAKADDLGDTDVHDLEIPATTRGVMLAARAKADDPERMTVVFSTYQSLQAINDAQANHGLPAFDLIVCDEAHRTTGAKAAGDEDSSFVRVHDPVYIKGAKRLYMTATPRIFSDAVRQVARDVDAVLCSMDDASLYGETLHTLNFSTAVRKGLLTDYKVIVLAVDEASVSASIQKRLSDENSQLLLDDATKIVGCYKALTKVDLKPDVAGDTGPMRRAVAFARDIKRSKLVEVEFAGVVADWRAALIPEVADEIPDLSCEVRHVDGTFSDGRRKEAIAWLEESTGDDGPCRILTNARCLSEGVDVPALDAILFLHPRKSQIDVVQAVGRVMRRAEGKKMGYVILPVVVPAGIEPEKALDDNEKYKVVWQILNALRAHDDRLDATINKIDLGVDPGDRIEVIAVSNEFPLKAQPTAASLELGGGEAIDDDSRREPGMPPDGRQIDFGFDEFAKAILARIVKKCGTRTYWEDWAGDVAKIAQTHITRIKAAVEVPDSEEQKAFQAFLAEIRDDLNDSVSDSEAVEMLAQHMITRPVFEALFDGYNFAGRNPVSRALQGVLDVLDRQNLQKETEKLERFYASVRMRAAGINDATAKQKIVVELYDKFFRTAFPRLTERLGIVYTPVEVVDFIVRSVDEVLRSEFGQTLGSEGVHIIDPFAGTGTFIVRLLQLGLIDKADLARKYREEIHANEIVLLAYYIAAINIEATYHDLAGGDYEAFPGICLTDTFQMYEKEDLVSGMMADNSTRRARQRKLPIKVIIGNPPYSVGQRSENDNAANVAYSHLDQRIRETYATRSEATNKNALYNSYIRAIRWGSDRLRETGGIMAYVTDAGWLDGNTMDGMRKCLAEEFTSLYVFHLRGNQRTSGEQSRREGGKIFGQGSRQPVAISIMVCNPASAERGTIHFHDVGDYLTREEKLAEIERFGSIDVLSRRKSWRILSPDEHGDWLKQRDQNFETFLAIGDKDGVEPLKLFRNYSAGLKTQRDAWCVNSSREAMLVNMQAMIGVYDSESARFAAAAPTFDSTKAKEAFIDSFVTSDTKRISWTRALKAYLGRQRKIEYGADRAAPMAYRPFTRQWLYFDRDLNEMVYQMPRLFPTTATPNLAIMIKQRWVEGHIALMVNAIPDLHPDGGVQCFSRWLYEPAAAETESGLFAAQKTDAPAVKQRDAITDEGLAHFQKAYPGETITKDDLFYFVYGLLHSADYRSRYADNLSKQLPRLPLLKRAEDFRAFVEAGRALGDLHVGYEAVEPYPVTVKQGDLRLANIPDPVAYYRVEQMKFAGKRPNLDKTTVIYNPRITMTGIPLEAYDYVVNGKPALEWIMERQAVRTDPASGIVNDSNRYAIETAGDPAYPFKLFCRVVTVSLETLRIVKRLPALDIREDVA
ncbi:DEAD/DEAH box helicase [Reyranella sp.]|uniref:DEAD/DEAH box helicase n=1 Tax=Reyranella sp. TaxID=1929291 RepID=UPI003BA87B05